jgi:hypothetical protein
MARDANLMDFSLSAANMQRIFKAAQLPIGEPGMHDTQVPATAATARLELRFRYNGYYCNKHVY